MTGSPVKTKKTLISGSCRGPGHSAIVATPFFIHADSILANAPQESCLSLIKGAVRQIDVVPMLANRRHFLGSAVEARHSLGYKSTTSFLIRCPFLQNSISVLSSLNATQRRLLSASPSSPLFEETAAAPRVDAEMAQIFQSKLSARAASSRLAASSTRS
ncbi:hypothetical protein VTN31DRAFT_803 [Thermomyces dupontii]|uniref:uncharacterized protein n=1 Tax=Talaromyces thermophilus TaxID=28565 RepID=UPI00374364CC